MAEKEIEGAPSGDTSSNSAIPLVRGDYAEIVAHAIGDSASALPGAGAFITAAKNIAFNVAAVNQRNRIIHVLEELNRRVADAERILKIQSKNEEFLVLFYRLLYWARDEVSQEKTEAFIQFGKKLLTENNPYDETLYALGRLADVSAHELKLLQAIQGYSANAFIVKLSFVEDKKAHALLGVSTHEAVAQILLGLMRKGLIVVTKYGAVLGEVASDEFKSFRLSKEGFTLVNLIK